MMNSRGYDTPSFKDQPCPPREPQRTPLFQLSPKMLEGSFGSSHCSPGPGGIRINKDIGSGKVVRRSPRVFERLKADQPESVFSGFKKEEEYRSNLREKAHKKYLGD